MLTVSLTKCRRHWFFLLDIISIESAIAVTNRGKFHIYLVAPDLIIEL